MSVNRVLKASPPVAMALLLASCGGAITELDTDSGIEPLAGAANGSTDTSTGANNGETDTSAGSSGESPNSENATSVSGRVADGYIQGATVCVDLNNSDTCDADEPSAMTGPGGVYDLSIPDGAEDKPIVADIPAEAIDEDTGEAVGKPLVFIAPANQPQFISPITTLVHQELQSNPSLNVEEAESAVKTLLGVEEQNISLFTDYVAGGRDEDSGSTGSQDNFQYLHDTARVVTSMMKDIESEVESAAQSSGIDVAGSDDTQRAIRDIVRRQVRQLLPEIAKQVAVIVRSEESTDAELDTGVEASAEFDPDKIALALRPDDVSKDLQERIDAVVDRVEPVQSDIKQLLTDGVYWLELDCYYEELRGNDVERDYGIEAELTEAASTGTIALEDNADTGTDGVYQVEGTHTCEPFYGRAELNAAGDAIVSQEYEFDYPSGTWVEEIDTDDTYTAYVLIDGQWEESSGADSGPEGAVEFTADGSAVISNSGGIMTLKAVTRSLDAVEVKKHFLSDDADPAWFELVKPSDLFPDGSLAHMISVNETFNPYMLFNEQSKDDSGENHCAEYFDNCNVVGNAADDQFYALRTLSEIREGAVQGMELVSKQHGFGLGANMKFMIEDEYDGTLPTSGSVQWSFGSSAYHEGPIPSGGDYIEPDTTMATYPADQGYDKLCHVPDGKEGEFYPIVPDPAYPGEGTPDYPWIENPDYPLVPSTDGPFEPGREFPDGPFEPGSEFPDGPFGPGSEFPDGPFEPGSEFPDGPFEPVSEFPGGPFEPVSEFPDGPFEPVIERTIEEQDPEDMPVQGDEIDRVNIDVEPVVLYPDSDLEPVVVYPLPEVEPVDPYPLTDSNHCVDPAELTLEYVEPYYPDSQPSIDEKPILSRWKFVTVDGVEMIEIQLPAEFRFDDGNSEQAVLLSEHNGFVRLGQRMADSYIDRVVTYNESAFTILRSIIESSEGDK